MSKVRGKREVRSAVPMATGEPLFFQVTGAHTHTLGGYTETSREKPVNTS